MGAILEEAVEVIGIGAPLVIAATYLLRVHTLSGEGRPVAVWPQLSFAGGILVIAFAVGGRSRAMRPRSFSAT